MSTVIDLVAESLGVMMVVTDMTGHPVTHLANPCPWFADHAEDEQVVAECVEEWRELADDLDFEHRFRLGRHGFLCARTFVRCGTELVGMVLVGGVAVDDGAPGCRPGDDGLFHLDDVARARVLAMLPQVASALSRLSGHLPAGTGAVHDVPLPQRGESP
jgi:hypothetical protein